MTPRPDTQPDARVPKSYTPETVLTTEEVAAWLDVNPKTVRTYGIKTVRLGHSTVRYLAKHVLEYLEQKAA